MLSEGFCALPLRHASFVYACDRERFPSAASAKINPESIVGEMTYIYGYWIEYGVYIWEIEIPYGFPSSLCEFPEGPIKALVV